jgi:hypothetical protein
MSSRSKPPLAPTMTGLERSPEGRIVARLDLDHDQLAATPAHQVELAAPGQETRANDGVAVLAKKRGRRVLAVAT